MRYFISKNPKWSADHYRDLNRHVGKYIDVFDQKHGRSAYDTRNEEKHTPFVPF